MPVAFAITRSEEEVARKVFTDDSPKLDGNLFRFRGVDVKPALEALLAFANDAEDVDEGNAALRLSGRLATWFGRNVSEQAEQSIPVEVRDPSPAPRSRRKSQPVEQAIADVKDSPVETDTPDE